MIVLCFSIRCPVKPAMPETTALGAAMAAGAAEGVNVWYMSAALLADSTSTTYQPQINPEGEDGGTERGGGWSHLAAGEVLSTNCLSAPSSTESESRFGRWKKAVQRSMNWETTETSAETKSKIPRFLSSRA